MKGFYAMRKKNFSDLKAGIKIVGAPFLARALRDKWGILNAF